MTLTFRISRPRTVLDIVFNKRPFTPKTKQSTFMQYPPRPPPRYSATLRCPMSVYGTAKTYSNFSTCIACRACMLGALRNHFERKLRSAYPKFAKICRKRNCIDHEHTVRTVHRNQWIYGSTNRLYCTTVVVLPFQTTPCHDAWNRLTT